jgi:hypothetical protein
MRYVVLHLPSGTVTRLPLAEGEEPPANRSDLGDWLENRDDVIIYPVTEHRIHGYRSEVAPNVEFAYVETLPEREEQPDAISDALSHHLDPSTDPCADRGVSHPCDVARALLKWSDRNA